MMREQHRQEGSVRGRGAARLRDPQRRRRAVMPIRDIERRQRLGRARQRRNGGVVVDRPELAARASMTSMSGAAG
jgi:hypothetical protein